MQLQHTRQQQIGISKYFAVCMDYYYHDHFSRNWLFTSRILVWRVSVKALELRHHLSLPAWKLFCLTSVYLEDRYAVHSGTLHFYLTIYQTAFFDVPLHMNFHNASRRRSQFDLRCILKDTFLNARPNDSVTFVDNHEYVFSATYNDSPPNYSQARYFSIFMFLVKISLNRWAGGRSKFRELGELAIHILALRFPKLSKVDSNFKVQAYAIILLRGQGHPYEPDL